MLKSGELTGADKIKTERDMIMDQYKETNYQGRMIDSIASNIKNANNNLDNINTELKIQEEQMNKIQDHVANAYSQLIIGGILNEAVNNKLKFNLLLTYPEGVSMLCSFISFEAGHSL